mmetsp:Transcript_19920/g.46800  ORF Transcript_19920/g.46800 Transcript_19920/m.46800 type:complete len:224 (-) Transcript_19920:1164-1835(-)
MPTGEAVRTPQKKSKRRPRSRSPAESRWSSRPSRISTGRTSRQTNEPPRGCWNTTSRTGTTDRTRRIRPRWSQWRGASCRRPSATRRGCSGTTSNCGTRRRSRRARSRAWNKATTRWSARSAAWRGRSNRGGDGSTRSFRVRKETGRTTRVDTAGCSAGTRNGPTPSCGRGLGPANSMTVTARNRDSSRGGKPSRRGSPPSSNRRKTHSCTRFTTHSPHSPPS